MLSLGKPAPSYWLRWELLFRKPCRDCLKCWSLFQNYFISFMQLASSISISSLRQQFSFFWISLSSSTFFSRLGLEGSMRTDILRIWNSAIWLSLLSSLTLVKRRVAFSASSLVTSWKTWLSVQWRLQTMHMPQLKQALSSLGLSFSTFSQHSVALSKRSLFLQLIPRLTKEFRQSEPMSLPSSSFSVITNLQWTIDSSQLPRRRSAFPRLQRLIASSGFIAIAFLQYLRESLKRLRERQQVPMLQQAWKKLGSYMVAFKYNSIAFGRRDCPCSCLPWSKHCLARSLLTCLLTGLPDLICLDWGLCLISAFMINQYQSNYFVLQFMGNTQKQAQDYPVAASFRPHDWTKDSTSRDLDLWVNNLTRQKVQVHSIPSVPSIQDMNIYQSRSSQPHLVRVFNLAITDQKYSCVSHPHCQLLVQYIPVRLSMVGELDLEEALTIMNAAFRGFAFIEQALGHFQIDEEMIGFTEEGRPKVWLNRQFHLNKSQEPKQFIPRSQSGKINQIYHMLANKVRGRHFSEQFKFQLLINSHNFQSAVAVIQEFSVKEELSLRRYIRVDLVQRGLESRGFNSRELLRNARNNSTINILDGQKSRGNSFHNRSRVGRVESIHQFHSLFSSPAKCEQDFAARYPTKERPVESIPRIAVCRSIPKISFGTSRGVNCSPPLKRDRQVLSPPARINNFPQVASYPGGKITFSIPAKKRTNAVRTHQAKNSSLIYELKENNFEFQSNKKKQNRAIQEYPKQDTIEQQKQVLSPSKKQAQEVENSKQLECRKVEQIQQYTQQIPSLNIDSHVQQSEEVAFSGGFKHLESGMEPNNQLTYESSKIQSKEYSKETKSANITHQANNNIAISFDSFGVNQIQQKNRLFSGPTVLDQPEPQTQMILHSSETSQSIPVQQNSKEESFQSNSFERRSPQDESDCIKMIESGEECFLKKPAALQKQHRDYKRYSQKSSSDHGSNSQVQNHEKSPFFANYTEVQSKFDLMIKKDSNVEPPQKEHNRKISALAHLQDQENEENKDIYGDVVVNRVDSMYEKFIDKNSAFSESMKIGAKSQSNALFSPRSIEEEDFLDVQFMEKSLDFKYKSGFKKSKEDKRQEEPQELNVAHLDSKLSKYEPQSSSKKEGLSSDLQISDKIESKNQVSQKGSAFSQRIGIHKEPSIQFKTAQTGFKQGQISSSKQAFDSFKQESSSNTLNGFTTSYYQKMNFYDFTMENEKPPKTNKEKTQTTSNFQKSIRPYQSLEREPYPSHIQKKSNEIGKRVKRPEYDQSRNRLEDRYKKYVKEVRSPQQRYSSPVTRQIQSKFRRESGNVMNSKETQQEMPTFRNIEKSPPERKNRVSYDGLRSILLN